MKALVVLSGGQDSTTCLLKAIAAFEQVHAITFAYGQRHEVEVKAAKKIAKKTGVPHAIIWLPSLSLVAESDLLKKESQILEETDRGLPSSFVPNRNVIFLSLAHAFAQKIGASVIITGVSETDYSGYPDCREYVIKFIEHTLNLASETNITIETPLMFLSKAETFKMAYTVGGHAGLNIILKETHTCYNGDHSTWNEWGWGCGSCPACKLRAKGWAEFKHGEQ